MEILNYKLKDICDIKSGKRLPAGTDFVEEDKGFNRYIRARDVKNGKINNDGLSFIDESTYHKIKRYIINAGDIAITIVANIGDVGYCDENTHGLNLTENCARLTNFKDFVNAKYLNYYLAQSNMKKYMEGMAVGAAQAKLGLQKLAKINIQLPKLNYQNKVVDILSTYDELLESNDLQIRLLEETIKTLYNEWFIHYRFPGYKNVDFHEGIPTIWKYEKIGDIMAFDRGLSYSSEEIDCEEGLNLINLKNIQSFGGFRKDGTKKYNGKYKNSQVVKENDLVMGVTDMTQERRTVGAVSLIPKIEGISVISADLVKVNSKIDNIFLYTMFRFGNISKYVSQFGNGANVIHLKPDSIKNKKILMPDEKTLKAFTDKIRPIITQLNYLNNQNDNLIEQRDLLLPRLMSGKLSV